MKYRLDAEKESFVNSCPSRLFGYDRETGRVEIDKTPAYSYDGEALVKVRLFAAFRVS